MRVGAMEAKAKEVKEGLKALGWEIDRFGHAKIKLNENEYRIKFQKISIHLEQKINLSDGRKKWLKLRSAYLRDVYFNKEGKLSGLKRCGIMRHIVQ